LLDLASPDTCRNPFPAYNEARNLAPVLRDPRTGFWLLFDCGSVRQALADHDHFSSGMAAAGRTNPEWMIFLDPPRHGKLRGLISKAFTPKAVADLEARMRELSRQLLECAAKNGGMDLVGDYATPLPMMVIAEMIGIPAADWSLFHAWSDGILRLSRTIVAFDAEAVATYASVQREMAPYLDAIVARRSAHAQDDLLTRLVHAEFEGEHLTEQEIAGFIELLLVAGQETTSNLIANAMLCLAEHPDHRAAQRCARVAGLCSRRSFALSLAGAVAVSRNRPRRTAARSDDPCRQRGSSHYWSCQPRP
jgi:cytochrome P450